MSPETHFFSSGYAADIVERGGFPLSGDRLDHELSAYLGAYEARAGNELALDRAKVKTLLGQTCESPTALFAAIVRSLADADTIVGEKTPDHIRWWRPISKAMPSAKFVFVVRDPRAVVESLLRMGWGSGSHLVFAERWRQDQLATIAAGGVLGEGRSLIVRYEDVVKEPQRHQEVFAAFLGSGDAGRTGAPRSEGVGSTGEHSIVLPWETWKENALAPVTDDYVDAWREALPSEQSLDVSAICHTQMKHFGYASPGNLMWSYRRRSRLEPDLRRRRRQVRRSSRRKQRVIDAVEL